MIIGIVDKRGQNAKNTIVRALKALRIESPDRFGLATSITLSEKEDVESLESKNVRSKVAIGYSFQSAFPDRRPQIAKVENGVLVFTGRIYSPSLNTKVAEFFATKLKRSYYPGVRTLFNEIEGDFAFITAEPEKIIVGRDPVGVQPLYYGENESVTAFSTDKKTLWKLGIEKTRSFPPGHLAVASHRCFKFWSVKKFDYPEQKKPINMQEATKTLQNLLENSVRKRVEGLQEVAVAFSGGLDSSLVAYLANRNHVNVKLIHVSLENQRETEEAETAAEELDLPLQVNLYREEDVEKTVGKVIELIEEPDSVKVAVGVPFFWVAKKTAESDLRTLLAGQGADELFGGYHRYFIEYITRGKQEVLRAMFNDVNRLHENNIERDVKICKFHEVELRLPFATRAIADFAVSLPLELKIESKDDTLRKVVLRKVAENMGLPPAITEKKKRAIQYSTGINNALKRIAKRHNLTLKEYCNKLFRSQLNYKMPLRKKLKKRES